MGARMLLQSLHLFYSDLNRLNVNGLPMPERPHQLPDQITGNRFQNAELTGLVSRHVVSAEQNILQWQQAGEVFIPAFFGRGAMPAVKCWACEDPTQRAEVPSHIGMLKDCIRREERQRAGKQHR